MVHNKLHFPETLHNYFKDKEMNEIYISVFLKTFAESFITLFIPIYLIVLGYQLFDVALYYLVYFIVGGFVIPLGMVLNSKIGIEKTLGLGTFLIILYYYILGFMESGLSYVIVALFYGLSTGIYFSAFHIEFAKSFSRKRGGKELSVIRIIAIISGIIGPLVGSLFISNVSFVFLFRIVAVILFLSIIPLFFTKDFVVPFKRKPLREILRMDTKRKALAYQASGIIALSSVVFWPLFIYFTLGDIVSLGIIISLSSLFTILVIAKIGRLADINRKKVFKVGVLTHAPSWILRLFFLSPIGIFFSNLYSYITIAAIDISFNKKIYRQAKEAKDICNYFLFREIHLQLGRIIILCIVMLTNSLILMFVLSFFITFGYLFMLNGKK